jgi:hypothetical protein
MGRLQHLVAARIIRALQRAFMRRTECWAVCVVVCGSIGLAQGGSQAPARGGGRADAFWLHIRCDDNYKN